MSILVYAYAIRVGFGSVARLICLVGWMLDGGVFPPLSFGHFPRITGANRRPVRPGHPLRSVPLAARRGRVPPLTLALSYRGLWLYVE